MDTAFWSQVMGFGSALLVFGALVARIINERELRKTIERLLADGHEEMAKLLASRGHLTLLLLATLGLSLFSISVGYFGVKQQIPTNSEAAIKKCDPPCEAPLRCVNGKCQGTGKGISSFALSKDKWTDCRQPGPDDGTGCGRAM